MKLKMSSGTLSGLEDQVVTHKQGLLIHIQFVPFGTGPYTPLPSMFLLSGISGLHEESERGLSFFLLMTFIEKMHSS